MSLTVQQQFQKLINPAENILIIAPREISGDIIGSIWALNLLFEKIGKKITLVGDTLAAQKDRFPFLKTPENIASTLSGARDFVLAFKTKYNPIHHIRTEQDADEFRIFITPEHGSIDPRDFSFIPEKFKFDLVIAIGAVDKESFGKLYEDNADIFYEIPVINIDHHTQNDNFGQLNIIDILASSSSEVLTHLLLSSYESIIDENIAQCLLTGIISETESFQKKNTTPKALQAASLLMNKGADQQSIINHLYKTQPLSLLKLWGRIMAKLQWNEKIKLIWAQTNNEDLLESKTTLDDIPAVLDKIKSHYAAGMLFLILFTDANGKIKAFIKTALPETSTFLQTIWPEGKLVDHTFEIDFKDMNMETIESDTLKKLEIFLTKKIS